MPVIQPAPSPSLLFVYGTLRRGSGHDNADRLAQQSQWLGHAQVTGALYRVSWHPALVLEGGDRIIGDVVRLTDPATSLIWLDAFESCGADDPLPHDYRREICSVMTDAGPVRALGYIWNLPLTGLGRIVSGDWLKPV